MVLVCCCDVLCAGDKDSRQRSLLERGLVLLVVVLKIGVGDIVGIRLQGAGQILRKELHARIAHLFRKRGGFVEAAFFRGGGHSHIARISVCHIQTKRQGHARLQRFGELFKLRARDHGLAGAARRGWIGAETIHRDHRFVGPNFYFGALIGGGRLSRW